MNKASRKIAGGLIVLRFTLYVLLLSLDEILDHAGEFHREDELGGSALTDVLERLEILQGHGLLVNGLGGRVNLLQGHRETFGFQRLGRFLAFGLQDGGLLRAFRLQDGSLLVTRRHVDGRFLRTQRLGHHGAADALG